MYGEKEINGGRGGIGRGVRREGYRQTRRVEIEKAKEGEGERNREGIERDREGIEGGLQQAEA